MPTATTPRRPHHLPGGGHRRRCSSNRRTRPSGRGGPGPRRSRGCRSWWWARGPICWWPTGVSPGWSWPWGPVSTTLAIEGERVTAGAGLSLPVLARRTAAAGLTRSGVGGRGARFGRRCRPDERRWPRLGHCGHARRLPVGGPGLGDGARIAGRRARASATGTPRSPPPTWSCPASTSSSPGTRPRARRPSTRSSGGGGPTSRAAATPARCSPTRRATRPAGSSTRCGLKGFRLGTAEVSPGTPTSSRPTRGDRPTTCSALIDHVRSVVAEATGVTLRTEVRLVGSPEPTWVPPATRIPEGPDDAAGSASIGRGRRPDGDRARRGSATGHRPPDPSAAGGHRAQPGAPSAPG